MQHVAFEIPGSKIFRIILLDIRREDHLHVRRNMLSRVAKEDPGSLSYEALCHITGGQIAA